MVGLHSRPVAGDPVSSENSRSVLSILVEKTPNPIRSLAQIVLTTFRFGALC